LKYYIPYALVVEEKKKAMRACAYVHDRQKEKEKKRPFACLLARSLSYRARARDSFLRTSARTQMAMYVS
jgi:hypothetical protein